MIVTFDITGAGELTPAMKAHDIGNAIGLPFEVVGTGCDEFVQLTIEIEEERICKDFFVEDPFNEEDVRL